jgi:GNAT superfamily N-acetyltransferase
MNLSLMAAARARHTTRAARHGTIHLRCLTPDDGDHVADQLERMSPHARYQRYLRPMGSLRPAEIARFVALNRDHVAVGAFDGGLLAGTAQFFRSSKAPSHAEVAVEVADSHHRRQVAGRLVHELARHATDVGITHFTATVLSENRPVLALIRSTGWQTTTTPDGAYTEVVLTLPRRGLEAGTARASTAYTGLLPLGEGAA